MAFRTCLLPCNGHRPSLGRHAATWVGHCGAYLRDTRWSLGEGSEGPGGPIRTQHWGEAESPLLTPTSLARIVILFIFTFEPCKACRWGRSVPATRCQQRSAGPLVWPEPGEGTGHAPPAPPAPPPTVAAAPGRGTLASHPRPAGPRRGGRAAQPQPRPWLRPGGCGGRGQGPPRRVRAPRPRPLAARPTFSLSPAPSALRSVPPSALLPPRASPPPAWSCVAFFCLQWKQFLAARRAPARRAAAEASGRRDGAGRAAGPAGGRAARPADAAGPMPRRDPRAPAARARGRPPPPAAPGSPRRARASLAGPPSDARRAPAKVCRLPLKGSGSPAPPCPAPAR